MKININKSIVYRLAKPKAKDYTISDGGGLSLLVKANGVKRWLFIYRFDGKQNRLGLGSYPDTTLANARGQAKEARNAIAIGINPTNIKNAKKQEKLTEENAKKMAELLAEEIAPNIIKAGLPIGNILEFKVTVEVLRWR